MACALGLGERQVAKIVNEKILRLENDENSRLNGMLPTLSWVDECEKKEKLITTSESSFMKILKMFCKTNGVDRSARSGTICTQFLMLKDNPKLLVAISETIAIEKSQLRILKRLAYAERKLGGDPLILLSAAKEKAVEMKKSALSGEPDQLNDSNHGEIMAQRLNRVIAQADRMRADVEVLQKLHASAKLDLRRFANEYLVFESKIIPDYKNDHYFRRFMNIANIVNSESNSESLIIYNAYRAAEFLFYQIRAIERSRFNSAFKLIEVDDDFDTVSALIDKCNLFSECREDLELSLEF
jgi:hypothetical protein